MQKSDTNDIEKLLNDSLKDLSEKDFRLSPHIYPLHYKLRVHPILDEQTSDNFTFTGSVEIKIQCNIQTKQIVLHANELDIKDESVSVITTKTLAKRASPENTEDKGIDTNSSTALPPAEKITTVAGVTPLNTTKQAVNQTSAPEISVSSTTPKNFNFSEESTHKPNVTLATTVAYTETPKSLASTSTTLKIEELQVKKTEINKRNFKYTIKLSEPISPGTNYTIRIQFSGKIDRNLKGLYRTSYKDQTGNTR